ncbi:hypothetical protein Tco_1094880 [Tanacetum coccineum]
MPTIRSLSFKCVLVSCDPSVSFLCDRVEKECVVSQFYSTPRLTRRDLVWSGVVQSPQDALIGCVCGEKRIDWGCVDSD